jgi:hypothetical protein
MKSIMPTEKEEMEEGGSDRDGRRRKHAQSVVFFVVSSLFLSWLCLIRNWLVMVGDQPGVRFLEGCCG